MLTVFLMGINLFVDTLTSYTPNKTKRASLRRIMISVKGDNLLLKLYGWTGFRSRRIHAITGGALLTFGNDDHTWKTEKAQILAVR